MNLSFRFPKYGIWVASNQYRARVLSMLTYFSYTSHAWERQMWRRKMRRRKCDEKPWKSTPSHSPRSYCTIQAINYFLFYTTTHFLFYTIHGDANLGTERHNTQIEQTNLQKCESIGSDSRSLKAALSDESTKTPVDVMVDVEILKIWRTL